jgi:hypothetical protein
MTVESVEEFGDYAAKTLTGKGLPGSSDVHFLGAAGEHPDTHSGTSTSLGGW